MPTYRFKCDKCGEDFEIFMSIQAQGSKDPVCPSCGSKSAERLYSNVNVNTNKGQGDCPHYGRGCANSGCCPMHEHS
jgi:putative FmdB family regulatory protein